MQAGAGGRKAPSPQASGEGGPAFGLPALGSAEFLLFKPLICDRQQPQDPAGTT